MNRNKKKSVLRFLTTNYIYFVFGFIFSIAVFLRFYNLSNVGIGADQGRDFFIAWRFIKNLDLISLGPSLSNLPNVYLGPFYYYLLTFWLWIFKFSPFAANILMVIFNLGALILLFIFSRRLFNQRIAIFVSIFFGLSYWTIFFSRFAWNPQLVPFFVILTLFSFYQWYDQNKILYFYLMIMSLIFSLQLHTVCLVLVPILIFLYFWFRPKKIFWIHYLIAFLLIFLSFSSLIYFEINNHFIMSQSFKNFFFSGHGNFFSKIKGNINSYLVYSSALIDGLEIPAKIKKDYLFLWALRINIIILFFSIGILFLYIYHRKYYFGSVLVLLWFILSSMMFWFVFRITYFHYLFIILPCLFLLLAIFLDFLWGTKILAGLVLVLFFVFLFLNLRSEFKSMKIINPYGLKNSIKTVKFLDLQSQGRKYNIWAPAPIYDDAKVYNSAYKGYIEPDLGLHYLFHLYAENYDDNNGKNYFIILGPMVKPSAWLKDFPQLRKKTIKLPEDLQKNYTIIKIFNHEIEKFK